MATVDFSSSIHLTSEATGAKNEPKISLPYILAAILIIGSIVAAGCLYSKLGPPALAIGAGGLLLGVTPLIIFSYCRAKSVEKQKAPRDDRLFCYRKINSQEVEISNQYLEGIDRSKLPNMTVRRCQINAWSYITCPKLDADQIIEQLDAMA